MATALLRLEQGNFSSAKGAGAGEFKSRINCGPGYRVYFGKDGDTLVVLLGGGTKQRQQKGIATAQELWREYMRRKRQET